MYLFIRSRIIRAVTYGYYQKANATFHKVTISSFHASRNHKRSTVKNESIHTRLHVHRDYYPYHIPPTHPHPTTTNPPLPYTTHLPLSYNTHPCHPITTTDPTLYHPPTPLYTTHIPHPIPPTYPHPIPPTYPNSI